MSRTKAILIAVDQLFAAIICKCPDATLSAFAYLWDVKGKRSWPRRIIDGMFFWEKNHCRESYESELNQSQYPTNFFLEVDK